MCVSDPFDYQVLNLSPKFYQDYPETIYIELMRKQDRPYNCLLIQSHYGYLFVFRIEQKSIISMLTNLKRVNVQKCINPVWITVK